MKFTKLQSWGLTAFVVIASSIIFFLLLWSYKGVFAVLRAAGKTLSPVFIGFGIAYFIYPLERIYENKICIPLANVLKSGKAKKGKITSAPPKHDYAKNTAIALTVITVLTVITALFIAIIPQLFVTVRNLVGNMNKYTNDLNDWALRVLKNYPELLTQVQLMLRDSSGLLRDWLQNNIMTRLSEVINSMSSSFMNVTGAVLNVLMGIFISVYFLHGKDTFAAQGKKLLYSLCKVNTANGMLKTLRKTHNIFTSFITGKIIDSMIIGALFFVILTIFNIPYAILLSVVLGLTNVIPYFGPIIGAVPCLLLMLLENPSKFWAMAIIIVVIQQFDGNILGPKILGNSTGLSSFWVIFSLVVGGGLFGFAGLVIGIPMFAVVYSLMRTKIAALLKNKGLSGDTNVYREVGYIDADTGGVVPLSRIKAEHELEKELRQMEKQRHEKPSIVRKILRK